MRLSTWTISAAILMVAFPMSLRNVRADVSLLDSAKSTGVLGNGVAATIGAARSTSNPPIVSVALPQKKTLTFPRTGNIFRPKAPNIHTHPKKKSSSWWPFGKK
jgi:hypothetical protein